MEEIGKSKVSTLTLNGENSILVNLSEAQAKEMYEDMQVAMANGSGHWCAGRIRRILWQRLWSL